MSQNFEKGVGERLLHVRELAALAFVTVSLGSVALSTVHTEIAQPNSVADVGEDFDMTAKPSSAGSQQNLILPKKGENCTTIRDDKDGRYLGLACESKDDKFIPVGYQKHADRPYGIFFIGHEKVYKCGYGNSVLPPLQEVRRDVADYCAAQQPLLEYRDNNFEDNNCALIEGTQRDSCNDGTFSSRLTSDCTGRSRRMYANFTTANVSILNVLGTPVKKPLSMLRSHNGDVKNVHYRTQFNKIGILNNQPMKAIMVRTDDVSGTLGWGWMSSKCVSVYDRRGGPKVEG